MTATILTVDDLNVLPPLLPCDMLREVESALASGRETAIEYDWTYEYNTQSIHYLYLPNAGRGAVCGGGNSEWTDCDSLEDLKDRWENFEERWSN